MSNSSNKNTDSVNLTRSVVDLTHQLNSIEKLAADIVTKTEDLDDLKRGGNTKMFKNAIIESVERMVEIKNVANKSVLSLAPHGNSGYVYRSMLSENLLPDYLTNKETVVRPRAQCDIRPDRKRKCRSGASCVTPVSLPPPEKGFFFSVLQVVTYLLTIESGKDRKIIMEEWIEKKFVPVKINRIYQLLREHKEGRVNLVWKNRSGPKKITNFAEITKFCKGQTTAQGISFNDTQVGEFLTNQRKTAYVAAGKSVVNMPEISLSSTKRYFQLASQCIPTLDFTTEVQNKTDTRFIAENSLINAMGMLVVTATTHLMVAEPDSNHPPISLATDGAKFLESIVSKVNGNAPIRPIQPYLNISTDDSTMFVFNGTAFVKKLLYLTDKSQKSSNLSAYSCKVGGTDHLNGLRVRQTHSMNAMGNVAPIYLLVSGLNERELPCPSGIYIMSIKGLCFGAAQDVSNDSIGYLVFMRNETDSVTGDTNETRNFAHYRNTVFIPWIESLREHYAGYVPGRPGIPVPEELTCCSWCDGGGPQLKNIVSPEQMEIDKKHRIISNKHARASTAVQQGCDACPVFKVLNLLSKMNTAEHLPMNGYKLIVKQEFNLARKKGKFIYV